MVFKIFSSILLLHVINIEGYDEIDSAAQASSGLEWDEEFLKQSSSILDNNLVELDDGQVMLHSKLGGIYQLIQFNLERWRIFSFTVHLMYRICQVLALFFFCFFYALCFMGLCKPA